MNVGTGNDLTIKELAETIGEVVGFSGEIILDNSKPDGAQRKLMDVVLLSRLEWIVGVPLASGLKSSFTDFVQNH